MERSLTGTNAPAARQTNTRDAKLARFCRRNSALQDIQNVEKVGQVEPHGLQLDHPNTLETF